MEDKNWDQKFYLCMHQCRGPLPSCCLRLIDRVRQSEERWRVRKGERERERRGRRRGRRVPVTMVMVSRWGLKLKLHCLLS